MKKMMIEIIGYTREYHEDFRRLNLEWLNKYNLAESHDLMVLDDPEGTILNRGGYIWLAKADSEIAGTVALVNEGHGVFELAKMCVTEKWQGKGISRMLIDTSLIKAKELNADKIILFSNHQLTTAIALYRKYGFQHIEVSNSPFESADVKMELMLK
jgi:putative acetyltransferase